MAAGVGRPGVSGPQPAVRLSRNETPAGMVRFRILARMPIPKQGDSAMADVVASCGCWRMQLRADDAVALCSLSMRLCS